jgi:hypothetical protein
MTRLRAVKHEPSPDMKQGVGLLTAFGFWRIAKPISSPISDSDLDASKLLSKGPGRALGKAGLAFQFKVNWDHFRFAREDCGQRRWRPEIRTLETLPLLETRRAVFLIIELRKLSEVLR